MWIRTNSALSLSHEIRERIIEVIKKSDHVDATVWLDLSSGGRVVLTASGGWKRPGESAYHALYVSPAGDVIDASRGLLGGTVPFDTSAPLNRDRRQACEEHLERLLGVTDHPVSYGQHEAVQNL